MKKITPSILIEQAKKESNLTLREAILLRVDFELIYNCRKNIRKDWLQAYLIIKKRFKKAYDWEIKPNRLYIINYFLRNYIVVNHLARDWWQFDGFKSEKEAAKIYNIAAFFLSDIYSTIIEGQYELARQGYKNYWKDWYKELE